MTVHVSAEQRSSLDRQLDIVCESFARAVRTRSYEDAVWTQSFVDFYGDAIDAAAHHEGWLDWKRDYAERMVLDKHILAYVVLVNPPFALENVAKAKQAGHDIRAQETQVTVEALNCAIEQKADYLTIQDMATELGIAHEFSGIIQVLEYIREL